MISGDDRNLSIGQETELSLSDSMSIRSNVEAPQQPALDKPLSSTKKGRNRLSAAEREDYMAKIIDDINAGHPVEALATRHDLKWEQVKTLIAELARTGRLPKVQAKYTLVHASRCIGSLFDKVEYVCKSKDENKIILEPYNPKMENYNG